MDLRKSSITADILNFISDGKLHTYQEIADEVEVSYSTVRRHIQSLSYRYPIEVTCGHKENGGGVYLDKKYLHQGKIRSRDELQIISQALEAVLICSERLVRQKSVHGLLRVGIECIHLSRSISLSHNNHVDALLRRSALHDVAMRRWRRVQFAYQHVLGVHSVLHLSGHISIEIKELHSHISLGLRHWKQEDILK